MRCKRGRAPHDGNLYSPWGSNDAWGYSKSDTACGWASSPCVCAVVDQTQEDDWYISGCDSVATLAGSGLGPAMIGADYLR